MAELRSILQSIRSFFLSTISYTILLILISVFVWLGFTAISFIIESGPPKYWTLQVFSSTLPNQAYEISRVEGFEAQTACVEKGLAITKQQGSFLCGYDCKLNNNALTCDRVCTASGCRE